MAIQELIWAGTEQSLQAAIDADEGKTARLAAGSFPNDNDEEEPRLLEVADGIATIAIKGSLNNDSGFWNEFCGMTGYPEIRDALIGAFQDASVEHIVLDIDSGGGAVSGVEDTAKLIRTINGVKPVTAYCDGTMCSAAYWLGSAAGEVYTGKTAVVGSIGVLSTHMERSEHLQMNGIGATVVRSGKWKALANGVEKLSADGKQQIQQVVDAAANVFDEAVAEMRGKSVAYVKENMAQGREFIGQAAVDVGLTDGITSFDRLISGIRNGLPSANGMLQNRGKSGTGIAGNSTTTLNEDTLMGKKALTEQDIAALAAGAALSAEVDNKSEEAQEQNDAAAVVDAGAEAGAEVEAQADAANGELTAEVAKVDNLQATVQLLNSQIVAKDAAILEAGIKVSKLEEALAEAKATHDPLLVIAAKSVGNMMIALGGSAVAAEGMSAQALVAEHERLSEQFKKKYPVGGVAAVQGEASNQQTQIDPRHKARVNAVRFSK